MNLNELKKALDAVGSSVQDLEDKRAKMAIELSKDVDAYEAKDLEAVNADLKKARLNQELARSAYEDAKVSIDAVPTDKKPLPVNKDGKLDVKAVKNQFISDFKNMVSGSKTGQGNGGLTIPSDIQYTINQLVRQQASLQNFVRVEHVSTDNGSRVYEKLNDIKPLTLIDDDGATIGANDDPELTTIKYLIHRYAGITTITNSLLKDTVDNILSWLTTWIVKKVTVTRNQAILKVMGSAPKKPTIAKFDDVKDLENNTLDPAIESTSIFITNQSGYNVLSKLKDAFGRYLIQRDVTQPDTYLIDGKPVVRIADRWLPDVASSHPLYFGNFAEAITLYDRENMSLTTTNIGGGGFETDTTKLRVIDRFDVEMVDNGAFAAASFKAIADQTPAASATTAPKQ